MTEDMIALVIMCVGLLGYAIGRSLGVVQAQERQARTFAIGFEEGLKMGAEEERRRLVRNVLRRSDNEPDFVGEAGPLREIADALALREVAS